MNRFRRMFLNDEGRLRFGWRLTAGILCYGAALYGVLWLGGSVFGALFAAWGLTNENLSRAPVWAQQVVIWHTDFTYALAYGASMAAAVVWFRGKTKARGKEILRGAALGLGLGAALTAIAFMFDSMRLERPLSEPAFSAQHLSALIVLTLGSLSSEALTRRLVFASVRERFGRLAAYAAAAALSLLLSGAWEHPMGLAGSALMSIAAGALYERGGMPASAALTAGWSAWTAWLFAWPDAGASGIYRMYTVSDAWLTGGNAGADCGLGAAIGWLIIAAVLLRAEMRSGIARLKKERITNEQDSHCNRRSGLPRRKLLRSGAAGDEGPRGSRRTGRTP